MNNFDFLKTKYPVLNTYWSYISNENLAANIILAKRNNDIVHVNALIESHNLIEIWEQNRPNQHNPILDKLMQNASHTLVDFTALVNGGPVRLYQYRVDWYDYKKTLVQWPSLLIENIKPWYYYGIGVYDNDPRYKYYVSKEGENIKYIIENGELVEESKEIGDTKITKEELILFNLADPSESLDIMLKVSRVDNSALYLVFQEYKPGITKPTVVT